MKKSITLALLLAFVFNISTVHAFEGTMVNNDDQSLTATPKPSIETMTKDGKYILMTREEFKNWLFKQQVKRKINLIQHHHTWAPSYKHFKWNNHLQLVKNMEHYHKSEKGWQTIAQNITTFPDGRIVISRPFNMAPEGSIGWNANAHGISIENIGNFDKGQDIMTKEQKDTIVYITALLCIKFNLKPSVDTITYHHWWHYKTGQRILDKGSDKDVKSCPGTNFFGGNSTQSAKKYFYPLVLRKMEEISASKQY